TTIEQDGFPQHQELDEMLRVIAWPASVIGAAISTERVMVPPSDAGRQSEHDVRITMGVMRDGTRCTALRLRAHDSDDAVIIGEDLVSGLGDLLLYTLSPENYFVGHSGDGPLPSRAATASSSERTAMTS